MSTLFRTLLCVGGLAVPLAGQATAPTLDEVLKASGIGLEGYVDTAYEYSTSDAPLRVFDTEDNGFILHQAAFQLSRTPDEGIGGVLNITTGQDADVITSVGAAGGDNFDVTQAYLQWASGPLTLMAGKYVTLAGAEVIWTPGNANASRSFLFGFAIPFAHTGVRASLEVSDAVTLIGGINNGWDQQVDTNDQKTAEFGLLLTPGDAFGLSLVAYTGKETVGATDTLRHLVDVVATVNLTDSASIVINADYGVQEDAAAGGDDATWTGVAGYFNFGLTDTLRGSVRAELFDDADCFRTACAFPGGVAYNSVTATLGYAPAANLDFLFEIRHDLADEDVYVDNDGLPDDVQSSAAVKAVYKF